MVSVEDVERDTESSGGGAGRGDSPLTASRSSMCYLEVKGQDGTTVLAVEFMWRKRRKKRKKEKERREQKKERGKRERDYLNANL